MIGDIFYGGGVHIFNSSVADEWMWSASRPVPAAARDLRWALWVIGKGFENSVKDNHSYVS